MEKNFMQNFPFTKYFTLVVKERSQDTSSEWNETLKSTHISQDSLKYLLQMLHRGMILNILWLRKSEVFKLGYFSKV